MVSRVQPQFPKKFRSEFYQMLIHEKILKIQQAERPAEVSPAPY
jgi:hypothetical protein